MLRRLEATDRWPIVGYLIACPYYSRPSQQGLFEHFAALAGRTEKPILLYNIPYRTGVYLVNETLFRLAALPNIVGVKDCCADAGQAFDLLRGRPAGFSVLTGEDGRCSLAPLRMAPTAGFSPARTRIPRRSPTYARC
jgi:4-hydroxy-tetrahydrodipicolinate synthase